MPFQGWSVMFYFSFLGSPIRRRSDYIMGFIAPAIGPNKSKKLNGLWLRHTIYAAKFEWKTTYMLGHTWLLKQSVIGYEAMYVVFHSNFAAFIVCQRYKPCGFPGFVWTDCWGNKSYYVITSLANRLSYKLGFLCKFNML